MSRAIRDLSGAAQPLPREPTPPVPGRRVVVLCAVALGLSLLGMETACDPLSPLYVDECDPGTTPTTCTGPNTYQRCSSGEGNHRLKTLTCEPGWRCVPGGGSSPCRGAPEGTSCESDELCATELRCVEKVCTGPSAEEIARCKEEGDLIDLSEEGAEVVIEIPLRSGSLLPERIRSGCGVDKSWGPLVADRFVRLDSGPPSTGSSRIAVSLEDTGGGFAGTINFEDLSCDNIYYQASTSRGCDLQGPRSIPFHIYLWPGSPRLSLLFYAHAMTNPEINLRVRLKRERG